MIQCQNCGQTNNYGSNFCRFCGTRMIIPQNAQPLEDENTSQPRPYMWKTDEYQVKDNSARNSQNIQQVQRIQPPVAQRPPAPYQQQNSQQYPQVSQPTAYQRPAHLAYGYQCPRCGTAQMPFMTKKISTVGWVVFAALLVFIFPLFWIGLLIKEDVRICPVCKLKTTSGL
jgi:RNA polymerase subunit RPABC4/transcription elongation factor Spt4